MPGTSTATNGFRPGVCQKPSFKIQTKMIKMKIFKFKSNKLKHATGKEILSLIVVLFQYFW
jgi:hypothetical protein